jgi:type III secretion protein V
MSIDADLRAGAIEQGEARRRRRALERESQLYGAMDGALKFVKGDAVAGVAIVLVNVAGGLVAGSLRGMELGAAARRYALLAIGDGLASQIPALLIAVAAGVAVTRVAAEEEGGSLPGEIARQLFSHPAPLAAVAILLTGLALAPGFPAAPFLALAACLLALARRLASRRVPVPGPAEEPAASEQFAPPAPVVLELSSDLFGLASDGWLAAEGIPALREDLWRSLGVRLPPVVVRACSAPPGTFAILLEEIPAHTGRAPLSEVAVLAPPDELALVGIRATLEPDPLCGRATSIVAVGDAERARALGPVRAPLERLLAGSAGALRGFAHHFVGVQEVQLLLDALEPSSPALVREVSRQVPAPLLAEVLRRLVEEGVSIRPLRMILEAVLEAGGASRGAAALSEACRRALRRQLGHVHAREGLLAALLLDPAVEQAVREALAGEHLALDPRRAMALLDALAAELAGHPAPPVVLTSPDVRRALRGLVAPRFPRVAVLAYEELPPELPVRPVGRIALLP